jgi:hypothetical protein
MNRADGQRLRLCAGSRFEPYTDGRTTHIMKRTKSKRRPHSSAKLERTRDPKTSKPSAVSAGSRQAGGLPWDKVDWSRQNRDIANRLGCALASVCRMRKQRGIPSVSKLRPVNWKKADWSRPIHAIAAKLGCSYNAVWDYRKRNGIERVRERPLINWDKVDWSLTNRQIEADLGCCYTEVWRIRKLRGLPKSPKPWMARWDSVDWSLPNAVIAEQLGCSAYAVRGNRKRRGIANPPRRHPLRARRAEKFEKFKKWAAGKGALLLRLDDDEIVARLPFPVSAESVQKWCRTLRVPTRRTRFLLSRENVLKRIRRLANPRGRSKCWELGKRSFPPSRTLRGRRAATVVWELFRGPLDWGTSILNKCGNPRCVKPDHHYARRAREARAPHRPPIRLGKKKLAEIRRRWKLSGPTHSLVALAEEYGVAAAAIWAVVTSPKRKSRRSSLKRA